MRRARFVALVATACVGACRPGGMPAATGTGAYADPCVIPAGEAAASVTAIGAHGPVDAANLHLRPRSAADSLVFAHVYETLVNVTCDGRLVSGLADRWSDRGDTTGRVWTLRLRDNATYHGEIPMNPEDVADAWRARRAAARTEVDHRAFAVEAIAIEADRTLTIRFRDPQRNGPRALADPYFAVHSVGRDSTRVVGSGPFIATRVHGVSTTDSSLTLSPRALTAGPGGISMIRLLLSEDARDLIDRGASVVSTRDQRTIEYAASRRDLRARPLPADRAYVLIAPARHAGQSSRTRTPTVQTEMTGLVMVDDPRWAPLRGALARDVLRTGEPQRTDDWWLARDVIAPCGIASAPRAATWRAAGPRRLVFDGRDPIAAALAQRLIVLAAPDAPPSPETDAVRALLPELSAPSGDRAIAAGVSSTDFATGLLAGADAAYLTSVPRRALDPCSQWRALFAMAPWADPGGVALLVESAPTLITSDRAPALRIDWLGVLRVVADSTGERRPR